MRDVRTTNALLTMREREVLDLSVCGNNDTEIAKKLTISTTRVHQLKQSALRRLYIAYKNKRI